MKIWAAIAALALTGCASREGEYSPRIENGMMRLGAPAERSRCFAAKLGEGEKGRRAAEIIEDADGKDDMRRRVLNADPGTKRAFIAASFACPAGAQGGA
jgi:hypothetical protein